MQPSRWTARIDRPTLSWLETRFLEIERRFARLPKADTEMTMSPVIGNRVSNGAKSRTEIQAARESVGGLVLITFSPTAGLWRKLGSMSRMASRYVRNTGSGVADAACSWRSFCGSS